MSRVQIWAIALAIFGGALGMRAFGTQPAERAPEVRPSEGPDAAQLFAELTSLREELVRTRARLAALERVRPAPAAERSAAPVAETEVIEEKPVREDVPAMPESKRMKELLGRQLESEGIDLSWSKDQEARIADDLGDGKLGAAYVVSSECRTSSCRVEIEHPDPEKLDALMFELIPKPAFAGRQLFAYQDKSESGTGRMTIYLARRGHHFSPQGVVR